MGRGHVTALLGRLAVVGLLFFALAGPASAATCWQRLMTDWYDGSIDRTYPIRCYHQAVTHLQPELQIYSSASDDIRRALQRAITAGKEPAPVTTRPAGKADSVPLPLLVLGGVALLLVVAGVAGIVRRRSQNDRPDAA